MEPLYDQPVPPVEPNKDIGKHHLNIAMATAIIALKDLPGISIKTVKIEEWREPMVVIEIIPSETEDAWAKFRVDSVEYNSRLKLYQDSIAARDANVSLDDYLEAKKRRDNYNMKKCSTAQSRDVDYYLRKMKEERAAAAADPAEGTPDADEIIIA